MAPSRNPAEELVGRLARRSFLALWSYANPRGKDGKELCDVLAVCDPDVVIFSVKNVAVGQGRNLRTTWERWQRAAIAESAKQIYGAERWLRSAANVVRADGSLGVALPDLSRRRVHRVAVALGSSGAVPIYMGDLGKGFVHVLSDDSLAVMLSELDTVDDLTSYLLAKEELVRAGTGAILEVCELDLLAAYLKAGRRLPAGADFLVVQGGVWQDFVSRPEYQARKEADGDSYAWDNLVDLIAGDVLAGHLEFASELGDPERALRVMARESRFSRRILGREFREFLRSTRVRARLLPSLSGVVYVFLATPHGYPREARLAELHSRCFVARGVNADATTVVGIATEQHRRRAGFSIDLVCLHVPQWTAAHQDHMVRMQAALGYFAKPQERWMSEDEYPAAGKAEAPPV